MRTTDSTDNHSASIRVALFGSYYRGYQVLDELLSGPLSAHVTVVGVATDNPDNTFISRAKRVWQYPLPRRRRTLCATWRGGADWQPLMGA